MDYWKSDQNAIYEVDNSSISKYSGFSVDSWVNFINLNENTTVVVEKINKYQSMSTYVLNTVYMGNIFNYSSSNSFD